MSSALRTGNETRPKDGVNKMAFGVMEAVLVRVVAVLVVVVMVVVEVVVDGMLVVSIVV